MATGVSLLGDQPAAFATAYQALAESLRLTRVLLLPTQLSAGHAERLESWLKHHAGCQECEIVLVSDQAAPDDRLPRPQDVVRKRQEANEELVFFADAGLNFQVAAIARCLGLDATLVHGDSETVLVRRYRDGRLVEEMRRPSAHLGLPQLLELHGLSCRCSQRMTDLLRDYLDEKRMAIPPGVQAGLEIQVPGGEWATLDLAYERHGLLVGLVTVGTNRNRARMLELNGMPAGKKRDNGFKQLNKTLLQRTRSLDALQRLLRPWPRLAVFSFSRPLLDHVRKSRHLEIERTSSRRGASLLGQWLRGEVIAPDWGLPASPESMPLKPCHGLGGDGPPLIVWVGSDPSATLASLHAHRPDVAYLGYDQTTADVVHAAQRICWAAPCLPVRKVVPIAGDNLGSGMEKPFEEIQRRHALVRADVSPGTKAQACVTARLLAAELWSLDNARHVARCLDRPSETRDLQPTPLRTQAIVVGGRLSKREPARPVEEASRPFYRAIGQFLDAWVREARERGRRLEAIGFEKETQWECRRGKLAVSKRSIRVEFDGRHSEGRFRARDGGRWFEPVVANALLDAGAAEVLLNLTWQRENDPEGHFLELDVAARLGRQYYAISCKSSSEDLQKNQKEIVAVAGQTLGRFAIPVLAVLWANRDHDRARGLVEESLQARSGAALLDLTILADPKRLREALEQAWGARSTRRAVAPAQT